MSGSSTGGGSKFAKAEILAAFRNRALRILLPWRPTSNQ